MMPKLRWPTIEEWGPIVLGAATVAVIAFAYLLAYNDIESQQKP